MGTTPASGNDSPGPVHATLYRIDPALIDPSVTLPTVTANQYIVLDDDGKVCRAMEEDELYGSYVDRNIESYQLDEIEGMEPNPDKHNVILTYTSGSHATVLIGSISLDNGPVPDHYYKTGGIIYPIDQSGTALLDATNTPDLAFIRNQYWEMAKKQTETNLMFAEIVASFASDVAALGHVGEAGNFITAPDTNGTVPTPPETAKNELDPAKDDQGSGSQSQSSTDQDQ